MEDKLAAALKETAENKGFAVGNDLVYLPDFEKSFNELFKKKVYTEKEIKYCDSFSEPLLRYASTWAAKEAVYKAVKQLDSTASSFKSIEIVRHKPSGKPEVNLLKHTNKFDISLSITHDGEYVWAIALVNYSK